MHPWLSKPRLSESSFILTHKSLICKIGMNFIIIYKMVACDLYLNHLHMYNYVTGFLHSIHASANARSTERVYMVMLILTFRIISGIKTIHLFEQSPDKRGFDN